MLASVPCQRTHVSTVNMAAQYPLDPGMTLDKFRQTLDPAEAAQLVHEADADLIGRVVHQQDGRLSGRLG